MIDALPVLPLFLPHWITFIYFFTPFLFDAHLRRHAAIQPHYWPLLLLQ